MNTNNIDKISLENGVPNENRVAEHKTSGDNNEKEAANEQLNDVQLPESLLYPESPGPLGLGALCNACRSLYPEQPNPLQVTARLKYWLGGPDPLDYISMYWNPGDEKIKVPSHWHYISFGLSDLHGDGRVHPPPDKVLLANDKTQVQSGFGLELTFRLKSESNVPATWPAALLQHLARYIFRTGNRLCVGDHITWHTALDNGDSKIRHMLVATDPQLPKTATPFGSVQFLQIIGCTNKELKAAQRGSGLRVLDLMKEDRSCGGVWLVTDIDRRVSAKEIDSLLRIGSNPNDLAGVSAPIQYSEWISTDQIAEERKWTVQARERPRDTKMSTESVGNNNFNGHNTLSLCASAAMSTDSFEMSSMCAALRQVISSDALNESMEENACAKSTDSSDIVYMKGVHLLMNREGASLIPLALKGRLLHGRHFTWRGDVCAVTLVTRHTRDALATRTRPYARTRDHWLQVFIPDRLAEDMVQKTSILEKLSDEDSELESGDDQLISPPTLPITFMWEDFNLKITVVNDFD